MPKNHGFSTKNPDEILPCIAGVRCSDCILNYKKCLGCSGSYFMKVDTNVCLTEAQIPDNYGHQNGNFNQIVPCLDGLCRDCKADHKSCVECGDANYLDEVTGVCGVCDANNGKWIDNKHCRSCHLSCKVVQFYPNLGKKCSNSLPTSCTQCLTTGSLVYLDSVTRECTTCEQDGELKNDDGVIKRCERCHESCKKSSDRFKNFNLFFQAKLVRRINLMGA